MHPNLHFYHESAALAHLGERQTEVHFESPCYYNAISGGTVFDPQKRHIQVFLLRFFSSRYALLLFPFSRDDFQQTADWARCLTMDGLDLFGGGKLEPEVK